MITNFKKITAYTIGAILGCLVLSPKLAYSQSANNITGQSANNITGTWQILRGDTGLGGTEKFFTSEA